MLTEIERKAWSTRTSAEQHKPEMACKAAVDQIERGELQNVRHAFVVIIQRVPEENGADAITILQAGDMSELAVEGALMRAARMQASKD